MKKVWADRWVKALRSGDYKQGQGKLHSQKSGFCVLGVLCHIVGGVPTPGYNHSIHGMVYLYGDDAQDVVLPRYVMDITDIRTNRGYLSDKDVGILSLSAMNDGGHNFATLATFIESNWENL